MRPVDLFLSRVDKPRRHGKSHQACCPAHPDKSPSLTISEADNGDLLLHCFAGCEYRDIMAAVGLTAGDGFVGSLSTEAKQEYKTQTLTKAKQFEQLIVSAAASADEMSDDDVARIALARTRIKDIDDQLLPQPPTAPAEDQKPNPAPFRPLGYNGSTYYYLPSGTEQVTEIKRGGHTSPAELMALAPVEWWDVMYAKKTGTNWQLAASECMRKCERAGIYSHDRERGRGAWFDDGRPVLHLGDKLLVDGTPTPISDHVSKFIYTRQAPIEIGVAPEPASDALSMQISDMFEQLNWNKPIHAIYAAGFCALAPICGGLKWRPHLWLTAPRGAGKTWIQDHMIGQMLGPGALIVQGGTSEAGIRQSLSHDARPIVFDEAESEDARSQGRMQSVIELARQASSDSTAQIVKGTVNGSGMTFRMRSMFMLGSINVALSQAADESRFTVCTINAPEKTPEEITRFGVFSVAVDNLFTDTNCAAIRGRLFRLMPAIRGNAKSFATAVAEKLGSQRIGDQVGTLIAGWYALRSTNPVSVQEARLIIAPMDFTEAQEAEQVSDEESCLNRIMQSQVRFDSSEGQKQRSIGELSLSAAGKEFISGTSARDANEILGRYGLKVEGQWFYVANQHAELSALLKNTAWAAGWRRILGRIEGATPTPEAVRFSGSRSRATRIPLESVTF
jgi:putative DNA primase/helicase